MAMCGEQEIFGLRYGAIPRVTDLVVFPTSHEQVQVVVAAAVKHNVCLIPYGGGTRWVPQAADLHQHASHLTGCCACACPASLAA